MQKKNNPPNPLSHSLAHPLWQGRTAGALHPEVERFNRSISVDGRLAPYDLQGSVAHARMLGAQEIISTVEAQQLVEGLQALQADLDSGVLNIDPEAEDIHTFIEVELTRRLGEVGKKLHTGRSRNDQVALDLRLYLRHALEDILQKMNALQAALTRQAAQHRNTIMPGYTHLQRAQPITFALHLEAYIAMLSRDAGRLRDCCARLNECPLGAGALAGSPFPLDRAMVAQELGFDRVMENTLDAVASRDFALEALGDFSILMMHLSRLSEEVVLWSSQEFGFVRLEDAHTTGSSMMPQKKNPDVAELVRGKTGRVYGSLITLLTVMKALPLAYNKDMQEDKEAVFDAVDTVGQCLSALTVLIEGMAAQPKTMRRAAQEGFLNATALANYLVAKEVPFREAYALVGQVVAHCLENSCTLESLSLAKYQDFSPRFEADLFAAIDLEACVAGLTVAGSPMSP